MTLASGDARVRVVHADLKRIQALLAKFDVPCGSLSQAEAEELYRLGCAHGRRSRNFWMLRPLVTLILNLVRRDHTHAKD